MNFFSANIEDLQGIYITDLKKALGMEKRLVETLPLMIDAGADLGFCTALRQQLEETRGHAIKLEWVLRRLIGESVTETCKVTNGLIAAVSETIRNVGDPAVRDIALLALARRMEHHQIAQYGTLRLWAEMLEMYEDAKVLRAIEAEVLAADQLLQDLSTPVDVVVAA